MPVYVPTMNQAVHDGADDHRLDDQNDRFSSQRKQSLGELETENGRRRHAEQREPGDAAPENQPDAE